MQTRPAYPFLPLLWGFQVGGEKRCKYVRPFDLLVALTSLGLPWGLWWLPKAMGFCDGDWQIEDSLSVFSLNLFNFHSYFCFKFTSIKGFVLSLANSCADKAFICSPPIIPQISLLLYIYIPLGTGPVCKNEEIGGSIHQIHQGFLWDCVFVWPSCWWRWSLCWRSH